MATAHPCIPSGQPATTPELIQALAENEYLFEQTAVYPQAAIHDRLISEWTMIVAYLEGRVYRSATKARQFLQDQGHGKVENNDEEHNLESTFHTAMDDLAEELGRHHRAVKALRDMVLSKRPSKSGMAVFRAYSKSDHGGRRAANGQLLSSYGRDGDAVPSHLGSSHNEDLDPTSEFMASWLMDPFLVLVVRPVRRLILKVPIACRMLRSDEPNVPAVDASVIMALSKHIVSATAVLCLTAAILTLDAVRDSKWRIVTTALFAMAFSVPAQYMGSRSLPLYILITAYFQTTVVFLGTTNDQKRYQ